MQSETVQTEVRDNAYWPDEVVLTDFAEQVVRAEENDRMGQTDQPVKDDSAYTALYFVS
jgi:hypothetical protein